MNRFLLILVFLVGAWVECSATHVAVLETGADESSKGEVSFSDRQYLTNVLREQAVKELPAAQNYVIMTRENIQQMLPPGKAIEDCEGSCLVETGKNISADYICQARVGSFGGALTLSAELYETAGNKLVSSFNGRGADVNELLEIIKQKSQEFFRVVKEMSVLVAEPVVKDKGDSVRSIANETYEELDNDTLTKKIEPEGSSEITLRKDRLKQRAQETQKQENANAATESVLQDTESQSKNKIHWVAISVFTGVAIVGGVAAYVFDKKAKDATDKAPENKQEFQKGHDEAKKNQKLRAISLGVMTAGVVAVGVTFFF